METNTEHRHIIVPKVVALGVREAAKRGVVAEREDLLDMFSRAFGLTRQQSDTALSAVGYDRWKTLKT